MRRGIVRLVASTLSEASWQVWAAAAAWRRRQAAAEGRAGRAVGDEEGASDEDEGDDEEIDEEISWAEIGADDDDNEEDDDGDGDDPRQCDSAGEAITDEVGGASDVHAGRTTSSGGAARCGAAGSEVVLQVQDAQDGGGCWAKFALRGTWYRVWVPGGVRAGGRLCVRLGETRPTSSLVNASTQTDAKDAGWTEGDATTTAEGGATRRRKVRSDKGVKRGKREDGAEVAARISHVVYLRTRYGYERSVDTEELAAAIATGDRGPLERWRRAWPRRRGTSTSQERAQYAEERRQRRGAAAAEADAGACWLREDDESELVDAEEAEEGDEGCGRGTSCALAVHADNALRTTTRRRQTRAATPVGRPGATAGGSECEAPDPMGALTGDTCPAQGMEVDGGGEGTADGDVRMGDRAEEEDRAGQASDESGRSIEGQAGAESEGMRGTIRAREESDEEGDDGRTGRWLPPMGRRRKQATPTHGERGRRREDAHQERAAARQRRQGETDETR